MAMLVAVVGASGYAGGELLRLLVRHPALSLGAVAAGASAGRTVGEVHPHLPALAELVLQPVDPVELAEHDLVFLALPHGESAAVVEQLPADLPVVDLGADFRLADPKDWHTYYGGDHAGSWTYGLPELADQRDLIRHSRKIANPGCYPTSVALAAAPILAAGMADPSDVVVVAASGTSGAGRSASTPLLGSEVMGSVSAYKAGGAHQHTPEMEQALSMAAGRDVTVSFTPLLAPMSRGILATVTMRATAGTSPADVVAAMEGAYAEEHFVHVLSSGWPKTSDVYGSNAAHVRAALDEHSGRVVVTCAIDNLVKGAAGQAIQNANLVLGLDEGAGLSAEGVAP